MAYLSSKKKKISLYKHKIKLFLKLKHNPKDMII